jgi:hypothetical protein
MYIVSKLECSDGIPYWAVQSPNGTIVSLNVMEMALGFGEFVKWTQDAFLRYKDAQDLAKHFDDLTVVDLGTASTLKDAYNIVKLDILIGG